MKNVEDLCAWVVVLLLLSSFLHSLLSFRETMEGGELEEAVQRTGRTLHRLSTEPGLLENLGKLERGTVIWRGEKRVAGEIPPGERTVVLPAALREGFSAVLVEVGVWE